MTDVFSKEKRSEIMSRVRGKDSSTERLVRSVAHGLGYRFRLHRKDLPGTPDLVFPRLHKVIFVHGCFWHGHRCPRGKLPSTQPEFWQEKIAANARRDSRAEIELKTQGWGVLIVWQCETRDREALRRRIDEFLRS